MATACLRSALLLNKTVAITDVILHLPHFHPAICRPVSVLSQMIIIRHGSFFNKKDAESVWDSATSVSNAGKRGGRASRGKLVKRVNLNIGQRMGEGPSGLIFPGLSSKLSGQERIVDLGIRKSKIEKDPAAAEASRIQKKKAKRRLDPLDRGYRGSRIPGRKVENPDPVEDYVFKGFETYVIESKRVSTITASQGTIYSSYMIVAVGNKKGLFGMAIGKGSSPTAALKTAKNKAAQHLVYVDTFEGHTTLHNFTEKYHKTSVIVQQAPKGVGLCCHPTLKIVCGLIGIKDIYVKSEGNVRNYLNLCRAFLAGLLKLKTHQEIADELGHHIVEYRSENDYYPIVRASPSDSSAESTFQKPAGFDYETYCYGGKLPLDKPGKKPHYWRTAAFKRAQAQNYKRRNQPRATIDRMALGLQPEFKKQ